jgi:hypothetical protein
MFVGDENLSSHLLRRKERQIINYSQTLIQHDLAVINTYVIERKPKEQLRSIIPAFPSYSSSR